MRILFSVCTIGITFLIFGFTSDSFFGYADTFRLVTLENIKALNRSQVEQLYSRNKVNIKHFESLYEERIKVKLYERLDSMANDSVFIVEQYNAQDSIYFLYEKYYWKDCYWLIYTTYNAKTQNMMQDKYTSKDSTVVYTSLFNGEWSASMPQKVAYTYGEIDSLEKALRGENRLYKQYDTAKSEVIGNPGHKRKNKNELIKACRSFILNSYSIYSKLKKDSVKILFELPPDTKPSGIKCKIVNYDSRI